MRQIILSSADYGVESRVFTLSPSPHPRELLYDDVTIMRARSWAAPASCDLGGLAARQLFARASQWADIIHYHYPWPFADLLELSVGPDKPKVLTYHSDIVRQRWLKRVYGPLMQRMLGAMDAIIATSPAYAATSPILTDPRYAPLLRVIPLGIKEETVCQHADETIFNRLGIDAQSPYFLFLGVLRYYKGLRFLIEAAQKVKALIVIAGDGPEAEALKTQVQTLGLRNVIFAGRVSDAEKASLLCHCHAFVLPSHLRSEAFGVVLIEAAMAQRPMISCEIGSGTSFVNLNGETGFVVPPESPDALSSAMNQLLENPGKAKSFGQSARQRYELLFSGPALGQAHAQLYQDVGHGH